MRLPPVRKLERIVLALLVVSAAATVLVLIFG
jgi:hypothetical protein